MGIIDSVRRLITRTTQSPVDTQGPVCDGAPIPNNTPRGRGHSMEETTLEDVDTVITGTTSREAQAAELAITVVMRTVIEDIEVFVECLSEDDFESALQVVTTIHRKIDDVGQSVALLLPDPSPLAELQGALGGLIKRLFDGAGFDEAMVNGGDIPTGGFIRFDAVNGDFVDAGSTDSSDDDGAHSMMPPGAYV